MAATSPKVKHFRYAINEYANDRFTTSPPLPFYVSLFFSLHLSFPFPQLPLFSLPPNPFLLLLLLGLEVFFSAKMVLLRKGFLLKEPESHSVGVVNWWKDIDESEEWERGIYFTLCAAYGFVSLVALV